MKKSIEKWVKKNQKGAPVRKPLLIFYPMVMFCNVTSQPF